MIEPRRQPRQGHAVRTGLARVCAAAASRTCCCSTATCSTCRTKRRGCWTQPRRPAPTWCIGERQFSRDEMPASRYHANRIGSRALSWFVGAPVRDTQCGFRVFRLDALRTLPLRASRLRNRNRDAGQGPPPRRPRRRRCRSRRSTPAQRSKLRPVRDTTRTCFLAVYYRFPRTPLTVTHGESQRRRDRDAALPQPRWTLHGLNNGAIFSATCSVRRRLPRAVSYAIGDASTWLAWRLMPGRARRSPTTCRPSFPRRRRGRSERRALDTLRAYARDVIDFLRRHSARPTDELGGAVRFHAGGRASCFADAARPAAGHHPGHRPLRQLGDRQRPHAPRLQPAADDRGDGRSRTRKSTGCGARFATGSAPTRSKCGSRSTRALQIRRRLADNRIVAMLMDRHFGRDSRGGDAARPPRLVPEDAGADGLPDRRAAAALLHRAHRRRPLPRQAGQADLRRARPSARRSVAAGGAGVRRPARSAFRAHPHYWYHFYRYWEAQESGYDELA